VDRREVMKGLLAAAVMMAAGTAAIPPTVKAVDRWIMKWLDQNPFVLDNESRGDEVVLVINFDGDKFQSDMKLALARGEIF
jgi:hypothetical protein